MSRYTRALRKQARAQAQLHQKQPVNAGSTTLLDEPEPTPVGSSPDIAGSDFDPGDSWTPAAPEMASRPDQVQALAPVARANHPGSGSPTRPVLPGREVAPETGPGHRRQPHNEGWLWRDKIRSGDLVVIVGEECSGKTRVLTDWIARVTAGQPFPGSEDPSHALPPSDVLVFNCIDDFQHSILDQVKLNGGNPDRVLQASTQLLDWGHSHSEFP
ncbi:MAG: AAA family ATPase, partial [Planctomycetaceae bacterium]